MTDLTVRYGHDEARRDLDALRTAAPAPVAAEPLRRLASYLARLEQLKHAGDMLVHEASHPTRRGERLLRTLVEYRRISDGLAS